MTIDVSPHGDVVTLVVRGDIDLDSSVELTDALAEAHAFQEIAVDLADVNYIDSAGLRSLLNAQTTTAEAGGRLRITAASSIVSRLIEITGVAERLLPHG